MKSHLNNHPILSICIPTYNRKTCLERILSLIIDQLSEKDKKKVEVCISDNNSLDGTEQMALRYVSNYPKIFKYRKNNKNLGPTYNALKSYKQAEGDYIWPIGDDDIIIEGSLSKIISFLEASDGQLDFIGMKCLNEYGKVMFYDKLKSEEIISNNVFKEFVLNDKFDSFGFMGANIFKRKVIASDFESYEWTSVQNNSWPHIYILLHNLDAIDKMTVIDPCIIQTGEGLFWYRSNWLNIKSINIYDIIRYSVNNKCISVPFGNKLMRKVFISTSMIKLIVSAKLEDTNAFKLTVNKIISYKIFGGWSSVYFNIFKYICALVDILPKSLFELVYFMEKKLCRREDFRVALRNKLFKNKKIIREGTSC